MYIPADYPRSEKDLYHRRDRRGRSRSRSPGGSSQAPAPPRLRRQSPLSYDRTRRRSRSRDRSSPRPNHHHRSPVSPIRRRISRSPPPRPRSPRSPRSPIRSSSRSQDASFHPESKPTMKKEKEEESCEAKDKERRSKLVVGVCAPADKTIKLSLPTGEDTQVVVPSAGKRVIATVGKSIVNWFLELIVFVAQRFVFEKTHLRTSFKPSRKKRKPPETLGQRWSFRTSPKLRT